MSKNLREANLAGAEGLLYHYGQWCEFLREL